LKTTFAVEPETLAPFFALLVKRIGCGSPDAIHELRVHFERGIKYALARQIGTDRADDLTQDVLAKVIECIQNGAVELPESLPAFVQGVVRRTIASERNLLRTPAEPNPISREDVATAERVLRSLASRDREILVRFYCQEQPEEKICREMGVTAREFRVIKSRAKDKFDRPSTIRKNI
jgi:DNA-directed RNA polymerase specialized sigma24 family protein